MNTLKLNDRQLIQLKAILKYAYKTYTENKKTYKQETDTAILELLAKIKDIQ